MTEKEPIAAFDPSGKAAVISYNVPEPSTFSGRHYIELDLAEEVFEKADPSPAAPAEPKKERLDPKRLETLVSGVRDQRVQVDIPLFNKGLRDARVLDALLQKQVEEKEVEDEESSRPVLHGMAVTQRVETPVAHLIRREGMAGVLASLEQGGTLTRRTGMAGEPLTKVRVPGEQRTPRLALVEEYRLSSFLGSYGASRTIETLTLLPGEEQKIRVVSTVKTSTRASAGTSILDSYSQETGEEFTDQVQQENSARDTADENFSYHAEAEASATWGWGSASVSGGVAGETNASRENFGRNLSNATAKHVASASSERSIDIQTSEESSTESSVEEEVVRTIKNINLSRTMNFVFRSLAQEYLTLLHLVDVRVAYHDTTEDSYIEVPLSDLDRLFEGRVRADRRDEVRQVIVEALSHISDYNDELHSFVETREIKSGDTVLGTYLRVKKDQTTTYRDVTGNEFTVPGILIHASKNTLKTRGVIVEALLGEGEALDEYSRGLQQSEVRRVELENEVTEAGLNILQEGDAARAEMYAAMFARTAEPDDVDH